MSVQAYQQASQRCEAPRETEYRLLAQVTRALLDIKGASRSEINRIADAVDWNRRVWSAFASDCASAENNLPDQLRAGIISLSIFVSKHSSQIIREGAEVEPLIDINRSIMAGLEQRAQNAAMAAGPVAATG